MAAKDKTVAYYYDQEVGNFNDVNLMRPHRVRLAHQLIDGYEMGARMLVHRPSKTAVEEMEQFHADGEGVIDTTTGIGTNIGGVCHLLVNQVAAIPVAADSSLLDKGLDTSNICGGLDPSG